MISPFELVKQEMMRTSNRELPTDLLRRVALVAEEAGEALKEALDLTRPERPGATPMLYEDSRNRVKYELVQTAAMAIRVVHAMLREEE